MPSLLSLPLAVLGKHILSFLPFRELSKARRTCRAFYSSIMNHSEPPRLDLSDVLPPDRKKSLILCLQSWKAFPFVKHLAIIDSNWDLDLPPIFTGLVGLELHAVEKGQTILSEQMLLLMSQNASSLQNLKIVFSEMRDTLPLIAQVTPNIKSLHLKTIRDSLDEDIICFVLENFKDLEEFQVMSPVGGLTPKIVKTIWQRGTKLRKLRLHATRQTEIGALVDPQPSTLLRDLRVCDFETACRALCQMLQSCPNLQQLGLSVSSGHANFLFAGTCFNQMNELRIGLNCSRLSLSRASILGACPALTRLDIFSVTASTADLVKIGQSACGPFLKSMSMRHATFSNFEFPEFLQFLEACSSLEHSSISMPPTITTQGKPIFRVALETNYDMQQRFYRRLEQGVKVEFAGDCEDTTFQRFEALEILRWTGFISPSEVMQMGRVDYVAFRGRCARIMGRDIESDEEILCKTTW